MVQRRPYRYSCQARLRIRFLLFTSVILALVSLSTYLYLSKAQSRRQNKSFLVDENDARDAHIKSMLDLHLLHDEQFNRTNLACQYPTLTIDNPEVWKHLNPVKQSRPDCDKEKNWVYVDNGTFRLSQEAIKQHGSITCGYRPIVRPKDDFSKMEGPQLFPFPDTAPLVSDFFHVDCRAKDGATYENFHMGIKNDPWLHARNDERAATRTHLKYNLLMFGFDSTSRMTFMRFLPKTYSYLIKQLGAVVMKGYNIVGDGTPAALFPILTGETETELPESRRGYPNASTVDNFPWIWKQFRDHGYVTQWAEDMSYVGTFQYRLKGFRDPPVDYYGRPFYLFVESQTVKRPLCFGSITRLQGMFDWIRQLFEMYPNKPKFSYLFHSTYSHDSNNRIPYADDELLAFLQMMQQHGYLDNTMLVIMTDHGARYSSLRATYQGKLEERLPFMSIRMPPQFQSQYPTVMRNLHTNSHRLTTPFDVHETFEHFFDFHSSAPYKSKAQRSFSLFELVPDNRTCAQADVDQHWCACLSWREMSTDEPIIQRYTRAVIEFLNKFVSDYRNQCATLTLLRLLKARILNNDNHLFEADSSKHNKAKVSTLEDDPSRSTNQTRFYQIQLETIPGHGQFEVTAEYNPRKGTFDIKKRHLSRMNKYGNAAACIAEKRPDLREICFCSDLIGQANQFTNSTPTINA